MTQHPRLSSDGTLLTQRMHFARMPFRNRHVLGWYRLILDMKEAGVNAITVFDSTKGRPVAKQKEVASSDHQVV